MLGKILALICSLFRRKQVLVNSNKVTAQAVYLNEELVKVAAQYVGVKESGGHARGPQVEEFQRATGNKPGDSWCMSFQQFCIQAIEKKYGIKSDIFVSGSVLTVWNKSPEQMKRRLPEVGSLVIWEFGETIEGHTGIIEKVDTLPDGSINMFVTIEGNTDSAANINRNGDGVYRRARLNVPGNSFKIKGFLRPFPESILVSK